MDKDVVGTIYVHKIDVGDIKTAILTREPCAVLAAVESQQVHKSICHDAPVTTENLQNASQ